MEDVHTGGFDSNDAVAERFFTAVDVVATNAVLVLDEAHGLLAEAGLAFRAPPSDRWYRLLEQLIPGYVPQFESTDIDAGAPITDRPVRRLVATAAAFFAAEAIDLFRLCERVPQDAGHDPLRARLDEIAAQAAGASRALLAKADDGPAPATPVPLPAVPTADGPLAEWVRRLRKLTASRSWSALPHQPPSLMHGGLNSILSELPAAADRKLIRTIVTVLGRDSAGRYGGASDERARPGRRTVSPVAGQSMSGLVGADQWTGAALARQVDPPLHTLPTVRGRDDLVAELAELLDSPTDIIQVLVGKAGCGKSTVALALARLANQRKLPVWWVSAGDANQLVKGMLAIATELGATAAEKHAMQTTPAVGIDQLWERLDGCAQPWLMVLDDADDPAVLATGSYSWIRPSPAGTLLITSRVDDRELWGEHTRLTEVPDLDSEAGSKVVLDRMGRSLPSPDPELVEHARQLSDRLGGVALALRNAGSYLGSPVADHDLAQLVAVLQPVDRRGDAPNQRHRIEVTRELSLSALAANGNPESRTLLRVLSYYAPHRTVPLNVLDAQRLAACGLGSDAADPVRAWAASLTGLVDVGLIESTITVGQKVRGVAIHPLVAEASRDDGLEPHGVDTVEAAAVELLLQATATLDPGKPADWPAIRRLEMHTYSLLDQLTTKQPQILAAASELANRIAAGLIRAGLFALGEELIRHSQACTGSLDSRDPAYLAAEHTLAWALGLRGQLADAEGKFRQLLLDRLEVSGPQHPGTLAARDCLAWMLAERGQLGEAQQQLTELLPDRQRHLGSDHPATLATRHRLAWIAALQGRLDEAEYELRRVLPERAAVLGADHMDTFGTRYRLAWVLAWRRRLDEAEQLFNELKADLTRVLEPHHAASLMVRARLAWIRYARGRLADAEVAYREVLADRERVLGKDHPRTLRTRNDLATVLTSRGAHEEAERMYTAVLADRERVLGKDHLHSMDTRGGLAKLLAERGRLDEAEERLRALVLHRQQVVGPDHPGTLATRHALACVLLQRGQLLEAEEHFSELLTDQRRVLGPHHRLTLDTREGLAEVLGRRGALAESERQLRDVLRDRTHFLGATDPDTLTSRGRLAWILAERRQFAAADESYHTLLPDRERLLGPDHPDTLTTRYRMAWLDGLAGRDAEAARAYQAVLIDQHAVLGADHPLTLRTRGELARALWKVGQLATAEQECRQLLADRTRVLGRRHPETLSVRHDLALIIAESGELAPAERSLRDLLTEQHKVLGPDHRDTMTTREHLAWLLARRGATTEAVRRLERLTEDRERRLGPDHPDTLRTKARLAAGPSESSPLWL